MVSPGVSVISHYKPLENLPFPVPYNITPLNTCIFFLRRGLGRGAGLDGWGRSDVFFHVTPTLAGFAGIY